MTTYQDIMLDQNYDLIIKNGDFVTGESSQQEVNLMLQTFVGNWFQYPLAGAGILQYLRGNTQAIQIEQIIKQAMILDGFTVQKISVGGSTMDNLDIDIQANRA